MVESAPATSGDMTTLAKIQHAMQNGHFAEAEAVCRRELQFRPHDANVLQLAGIACANTGKLADGAAFFARAAIIRPDSADIQSSLGVLKCALGDYTEGIEHHRLSVQLDPRSTAFLNNLSDGLRCFGQVEEAVSISRRAVAIDPKSAVSCINLGAALAARNRPVEAISVFRQAITLSPESALAWNNLATCLESIGLIDEAVEATNRANALDPSTARFNASVLSSATLSPEKVFAEHLRWAAQHAAPLKRLMPIHENDRTADRKLRIGYVSPDFRDHAVAYFIEPILENHDREAFEVFLYSATPSPDGVTRRLASYCSQWRDISNKSDEETAALVQADQIDILVDLATHTVGNRLLVFARKPAPVQVTYLGYAATTGLDTIDWRLTDALIDPPGLTEKIHTEKLYRLPQTHWCFRPPAGEMHLSPPPFEANQFLTFGSTNRLAKVTPTAIEMWAKVLAAVPRSRLAIIGEPFDEAASRELFKQAFDRQGIDASRLSFSPWLSLADYFQFITTLDIALDTFPFNGGTTTCHCLWMGVPVVSLAGAVSVSRVGKSILHNIGCSELATDTQDEFVAAATALARDESRLRTLRFGLRERIIASPLRDERGFTRNLEVAFRAMWKDWITSISHS